MTPDENTSNPPEPDGDGRDQTPLSGVWSRRRFLGLVAAAGATAFLGGCTGGNSANPSGAATTAGKVTTGVATTTAATMGELPPKIPLDAEPPPLVPAIQPATAPAYGAVALGTDVCVVGGGAAGMAAATAAARLGVRTVLLEEAFSLGGNMTLGLVAPDRIAYGGSPMVAGYFEDVFRALAKTGNAVYPSPETQYSTPYDPDALRREALRLARASNVDVRLDTKVTSVQRDEREIVAVSAASQGQTIRVTARVFLDCSGDGNLGYLAGHPYWMGDRNHHEIQGQTVVFHASPVNFAALQHFAEAEGSLVNAWQVVGLRTVIRELRKAKRLSGSGQDGVLINRKMEPSTVSVSWSQVYENQLDPEAMADIAAALETQDYQLIAGLKDVVPGFEHARVVRLADRPYLREGRRLAGLIQLTGDDVLAGRKTDDSVARGWYPIDLHVAYGAGKVHYGQPKAGDWYSIPYRCLVARDVDNLMMAGRCISVTHEALGSVRISPTSIAVGQAAGIAAASAVKTSRQPSKVDVEAVRAEITAQGGML